MKKITLIIPCHNEEKGIEKVLSHIPHTKLAAQGYILETIVIDNNSTDHTREVAERLGARVLSETKQGKGAAVLKGFTSITSDTNYVVMLDGDNTYKVSEILRLIEPLESNFCDVVVGSRLSGKARKNAFKFKNRAANWFYTFLVRQFYNANITDVLSGYFAWKKSVIDHTLPHLKANGFAIEMEMITKTVKLGYEIYSVPITYDQREGETKLNTLRDGTKILIKFLRNLFWKHESQK